MPLRLPTRTISIVALLAAAATGTWQVFPVDTAGTAPRAWWTSMAVNGQEVHIAYARHTNTSPQQTTINYALSTDRGQTWTLETVDTSANYGSGYALLGWYRGGLALDNTGAPQVAYTVESGLGTYCMRARRTAPGTWDLDTAERRTNAPLIYHDADIKIGSDGYARVVYSCQGEQVRFAREQATGWLRREVVLNGNYYAVGLALDSADNPHVALARFTDTRYSWSSDGGTSWPVPEVVDTSWWHVDIALDDQCRPHIAYVRANDHVRFARREGPGNWSTFFVEPGGLNCCRPSIFCTPGTGNIRLGYYPYQSLPLVKAALTTDRGETWDLEQVANTGGVYQGHACPDVCEDEEGRYLASQFPGHKLGFAVENNVGVAGQLPLTTRPLPVSARPNPCRARATVRLARPTYELTLHDAAGRRVAALPTRGHAEVELDAGGLAPGVYFVSAGPDRCRLVVSR